MIPHTRKHHIITVHYGESEPTKTLIEQLLTSSSPADHIIVIDHAQLPLPTLWDKGVVTVVRPAENSGYAGGINLGLGVLLGKKVARDDIVIAINNDMAFSHQTLARIKDWWRHHPEPAVAGVKMGQVNLLTGRAEIQKDYNLQPTTYQLPYLHGSLLTAPLSVFLALQGLPNQYFMYWEDVLFSLRARQVGLPLKIIENIGVTHNDSLPPELSSNHLYYLVRNGAFFLSRSSPRPWRFFWLMMNPVRLLYHYLRSQTPREVTVRQALRDAVRKRMGKRP